MMQIATDNKIESREESPIIIYSIEDFMFYAHMNREC